jgi:diguanylate cyclase (GGDEF)-like protein
VVTREAGKSFDPEIVELLGRRYLELEELSQAQPSGEQPKLSMDVKVERGKAPDAGFEGAASHDAGDANNLQNGLRGDSDKLSMFDECAGRLGTSLSLAETLSVLCSRVARLVASDAISVYLVQGSTLVPRYVNGENFKLLSSLRVGMGEGVAGWVAENHKPILNGNPMVEPGYCSGPKPSIALNSVLAVPLQTGSGTIGVLALYRAERDAFSRNTLEDLLAVRDKISLAVESSLQQEHSEAVRNTDAITGLPNARALFSSIEAEIAKRRGTSSGVTVLFCGLEGVYDVHESFGRAAAEEALRLVARGFRESCREVDYLARPGGDDFVLVLPGVSAEWVDTRIGTLEYVVQEGSRMLGATELLSLSTGAVSFPWDGDTPEKLVAEAEKRMFAVRRSKVESSNPVSLDLVHMNGVHMNGALKQEEPAA